MNETEKNSSNLTFDHGELLARVDNDRELLQDLLTIFKEEFPRHLQALHEAVDSGDGKLVAIAAHTMKGMLLNMAAGSSTVRTPTSEIGYASCQKGVSISGLSSRDPRLFTV